MVVSDRGRLFHEHDAIEGTSWQAQFATRAITAHDRVHLLGCADDCIDRAGLDAQRTTDAALLNDECDRFQLLDSQWILQ